MAFTLKQLRYFVAAAENGSLTAAAEKLRIAQPSLSAAIGQLEEHFGLQLFLRYRARGLSLTPSGRDFLADARRLVDHAEEIELGARNLGESLEGVLQVGCFTTLAPVFLPRLLNGFAIDTPSTTVEFREAPLDVLQEDLLAGTCEIALTYDLDLSNRLDKVLLTEVPPYVLLAADHPLAKRRRLDLRVLSQEPMVLLDLPHSREYFRSIFLAAGVEPNVRHRTRNVEMLRGLVANGDCFSLLSVPALSEIPGNIIRCCF